jgi:hypothetical protein
MARSEKHCEHGRNSLVLDIVRLSVRFAVKLTSAEQN